MAALAHLVGSMPVLSLGNKPYLEAFNSFMTKLAGELDYPSSGELVGYALSGTIATAVRRPVQDASGMYLRSHVCVSDSVAVSIMAGLLSNSEPDAGLIELPLATTVVQ